MIRLQCHDPFQDQVGDIEVMLTEIIPTEKRGLGLEPQRPLVQPLDRIGWILHRPAVKRRPTRA